MKNGNAIAIYDIAAKYLTTVQVCVDRLHELGATHELKLLMGRLTRLVSRSSPSGPEEQKQNRPV